MSEAASIGTLERLGAVLLYAGVCLTSTFILFAVSLLMIFGTRPVVAENPAPTPPMGWNEWDSYGLSVTESEFQANAAVLARLRQYGWRYAVLDAGWYETDPKNLLGAGRGYQLDGNGRLIPAVNRFPSATDGEGFRRLADWLHARGLKLGIHVMLGIPRQAVEQDVLLSGSSLRASEAANTAQTCPWDREFYAVRDNAAGQAWYDSIARQYADWGVDLMKVGCGNARPFRSSEIRQLSDALRKVSRSIVLSLSPGPPPPEYTEFVDQYAQMWRVSAEHWDVWSTPHGDRGAPVGLREEFDIVAKWASAAKGGSWIDPDDLANGWLGPHPARGTARPSQLTREEQRTEFTLWAFARAPLIEGTNLRRLDPFTRGLMTDRRLLDIDQNSRESHPITNLPAGWNNIRVWEAETTVSGRLRNFFAFFNLGDSAAHLDVRWSDLGISRRENPVDDLRGQRRLVSSDHMEIVLPAHGSAVYGVQ